MEQHWVTLWEQKQDDGSYRLIENRAWHEKREALMFLRNIFDLTEEQEAALESGPVETPYGERVSYACIDQSFPRTWIRTGPRRG